MQDSTNNQHAIQARMVASEQSSGELLSVDQLPSNASMVNVLGVDYVHTTDEKTGDLYLTTAGYPYAEHLNPDSWYEPEWFQANRVRLQGTSLIFAVPTKPVRGKSLSLVVKYSRVGERVPIDTAAIENLLSCEFNGPFEEFALVEELRHGRFGPPDLRIRTQLPLAIFVPPERTQPSQTGRFQWRIANKVAQHPGVALDIMRQYIMIYRWIPGFDAWQAHGMDMLSEDEVRKLNVRATEDMKRKGFSVLDMKPEHIIVERAESDGLIKENGRLKYSIIDYELMERTGEHWRELQTRRKQKYGQLSSEILQAGDDTSLAPKPLPENLHSTKILGVDYIHGWAESTGGMLWVVGGNADLFDFFLPERWRTTPHLRLIEDRETYLTTSKDNIHFVWKVSQVGEPVRAAAFGVDGFRAKAHGYNSPFEEVAMAQLLRRHGIPAIIPRAVYSTGHRSKLDLSLFDVSRYRNHASLKSFDGEPALDHRRNYITIWDYWNGSEGLDARGAAPVGRALNVVQAVERGLLNAEQANELVAKYRERLASASIDVFRLLPEHILLSLDTEQTLTRDEEGGLCSCLSNFQFLSPLAAPAHNT